jgi:hypothetical protein
MKEQIKTIEIEKNDEGRSVGDIFNKLDDLSNGFFEESQNFINQRKINQKKGVTNAE